MGLFGSKSILGVDLGTSGIKIAELSRSGGGRFELKNYGILDFIPKDKSITPKLDDQTMIGGLKDILRKGKFSIKDTIASISSFLTFTTIIELPYLSEKDLARAIPFEARKYIPVPLKEVVLDWSIINAKQVGDHTNVEVFLAAVPQEQAERYKNIFISAGLNLKALELENIALGRVLTEEGVSPVTIVNLGGRSTSITVLENRFERISRNYEVGGFEVAKILSEKKGISFEDAEKIKKIEGLKSASPNFGIIAPLIDMIIFEVKKVISNYEEGKKQKISKIILAGGQANMPGLKDYFTEKLGKDIMIGDPLKNVSYNKVLEPVLRNLASSLSVAMGLAMRKI
jgi:type IV pilus assembly protein PilM